MATKLRIHVAPPDMNQPITTPYPVDKANRWNSQYDDAGLEPLLGVFMTQPAYSRICVHSASDMQNEVGGFLVGEWCVNAKQGEQFILVEHALPARYTKQGAIYLTFTQVSGLLGLSFVGNLLVSEMIVGALVGFCIGLFIGVTEGLIARNPVQAGRAGLIGGLLGLVAGAIGLPLSEMIFQLVGAGILGRALGWGVFGTLLGLAQGVIGQAQV